MKIIQIYPKYSHQYQCCADYISRIEVSWTLSITVILCVWIRIDIMEETPQNETSETDIVGLNNRLARYIDTVRQLELKKGSLKKKLKSMPQFEW